MWAKRGTRPRAPRPTVRMGLHLRAVCPERVATAALVLPCANVEAMNLHLEEISKQVAAGAHAVLLLDGAGYYKETALDLPQNITLLPLPSYSPELNPAENNWGYLRQARQHGLRNLRRDRRQSLRGLDVLRQRQRTRRLDRHSRMGKGQCLGPLVLSHITNQICASAELITGEGTRDKPEAGAKFDAVNARI